MKKIYFLSFLLNYCLISFGQVKPFIYSSKYNYTIINELSDEFDSLKYPKWFDWDNEMSRDIGLTKMTYSNPNNLIIYKNGNNSFLKIIAKKEYIKATNGWSSTLYEFPYQSGVIKSVASFKYGYFELRAKLPKEKSGCYTAFWLWSSIREDNKSEIDVFETTPIFPYLYPMAMHYGPRSNGFLNNEQTCTHITQNLTDDFHTYGLDWYPDRIDWYIDGKLIKSSSSVGNVSVDILEKMPVILWNVGKHGIEPSKVGDEFLVDYFRYFRRNPIITLNNYDYKRGYWTYQGTTESLDDSLFWIFDNNEISNITIWKDNKYKYIKFKKLVDKPLLKLAANKTYIYNESWIPSIYMNTESSQIVSYDNPSFYYTLPVFKDSCMVMTAHAVSGSSHSEWSIGLIKEDGTIDWSNPQIQWGLSAFFKNLKSGKKYVINHGVYNNYVSWNSIQKEVTVNFDSEFYVEEPIWENNQLNLKTFQVSDNPHSEWHINLIKDDGSLDYSVDQVQWGNFAIFKNLTPGKKYWVVHGNYGNYSPWVQTGKVVQVNLNSNFEFYEPQSIYLNCTGSYLEPIQLVNNILKLNAYSYTSNYKDVWYLYLTDNFFRYNENDLPIQGPLYGKNATFNVAYNKSYMVKHIVYDNKNNSSETRKTIQSLKSDVIIPDDANNIDHLNIKKHLKIYPNPIRDILYVDFNIQNFNEIIEIKILNSNGEIVKTVKTFGNCQIDLLNLSQGLYFINIKNDKFLINDKFIKI